MSLPLHTWVKSGAIAPRPGIYKVLQFVEALEDKVPLSKVYVDLRSSSLDIDLNGLTAIGLAGVLTEAAPPSSPLPTLIPKTPSVIAPGDVIRIQANGQVNVLYRRAANANALFITERCNSRCIMCSQPPREDDDTWRIQELYELLPLIDSSIDVLGVTGGEPTLLGPELARYFAIVRTHLSKTTLHVLTNGRTFSDIKRTAEFDSAVKQVVWAIPLYADITSLHDFIVQAPGAFNETLHGIYNLAERGHRIELRCVVQRQNFERLPALSEFIYRNLPFVEHVALMGLEPMGYARVNRDLVWIDPADCRQQVELSAVFLDDRGIAVSVYNFPLCVLGQDAWRFARQSISDWKNIHAPECAHCAMRDQCCGFFQSAGPDWRSRNVRPVIAEVQA